MKQLEIPFPDPGKTCTKCGKFKSFDSFAKRNTKNGYQSWCTECVNEAVRAAQAEKKAFIREHKQASTCQKCGETKWYLLDYHHKDPEDKDFNIAKGHRKNMDLLVSEIEKCITLCSNCHREFHHFERLGPITIEEYLESDWSESSFKV